MKNSLLPLYGMVVALHFFLLSCKGDASTEKTSPPITQPKDSLVKITEGTPTASSSTPSTPPTLKELGRAEGDLDKDGVKERAIVFDTPRTHKVEELEMGTEREIHIFKEKAGKWEVWHTSKGAVMSSEHGGMMGDPFQEITIENGCLVMKHFGGSREKWEYTHRYRFQDNDWFLIGATVHHGAPCEFWSDYDYNLSTGKVEVKEFLEKCEEKDPVTTSKPPYSFTTKIPLPKMDGFEPGDNEVKIPRKNQSFYY